MDEGNEQAIQNLGLFNSFTIPYKTVNNHEITTDILIPKNIKPGKCPLLVRFHGGGLVTGSSSFIGFFPAWVSEYAHAKSAVVVLPNYRLLPEARGADILEDISDFWAWVTGGKLQTFVESREEAKGVVIDLDKIWAHGESAGGYLSIQSGLLLQPGTLRIISAAFPMLDWHDPWYTTPHTAPSPTSKPFFNAPLFPRSLLTSHLQSLAPGSTISAADPPERIDLMLSIGQQARWAEFLGTEDKLYPMREIEKRDEFPPVFIFHGKDDSAVPAVGTERFVDVYKRRFGAEKILCRIEEGDHGFDKPSKLEDEWLVQGLGFVEKEWLG